MKKCHHHLLSPQTVEKASQILKALSDPTRIRILYLLSEEECSVNHIAEILQLSQSAVSHQLSILRNLRLVKHERQGKQMIYSCDDEHVIHLLRQTIIHIEHD